MKVTKGPAADARVRVDMRREFFNVMAREGKVPDWVEAFTYGQAKAIGARAVPAADRQRRRAPAGARAHAEGATQARGRRWKPTATPGPRPALVVGGELLGEERQRAEQEEAHHDQREVFVHGLGSSHHSDAHSTAATRAQARTAPSS